MLHAVAVAGPEITVGALAEQLGDRAWLPEHRWIAEIDGRVGRVAAVNLVSGRPVYAGVAEASVYAGDSCHGRGVGRR